MSGHSKWSTIKHKKAAADAKRGKVFTRLAKEITVAAREGGSDPLINVRLRLAVDKAKAANMPKDNIERAIKRGTGELEGSDFLEVLYEAYAPHGIGILIEVVTDNKNRTIADVRHVINKYGGSMAEAGAVGWQFSRMGYIGVNSSVDQDELFMIAVEAGADDVQFGAEIVEIFTSLENFQSVRNAISEADIPIEDANVIYKANNTIELSEQQTLQVMNFIEQLEELDDIQDVYSTLEISDEAIAALEAA
jgi:YebC/PmpR family DNA-binding regulatory protein